MSVYRRIDDGSRVSLDSPGRPIARPGNRETLNIPAAERLLEITCAAAGSVSSGPRLVAVVNRQWQLQTRKTPGALQIPGQVWTPCRCSDDGHRLDRAKVTAAADRLQYRPRKARRIDVGRVAPGQAP